MEPIALRRAQAKSATTLIRLAHAHIFLMELHRVVAGEISAKYMQLLDSNLATAFSLVKVHVMMRYFFLVLVLSVIPSHLLMALDDPFNHNATIDKSVVDNYLIKCKKLQNIYSNILIYQKNIIHRSNSNVDVEYKKYYILGDSIRIDTIEKETISKATILTSDGLFLVRKGKNGEYSLESSPDLDREKSIQVIRLHKTALFVRPISIFDKPVSEWLISRDTLIKYAGITNHSMYGKCIKIVLTILSDKYDISLLIDPDAYSIRNLFMRSTSARNKPLHPYSNVEIQYEAESNQTMINKLNVYSVDDIKNEKEIEADVIEISRNNVTSDMFRLSQFGIHGLYEYKEISNEKSNYIYLILFVIGTILLLTAYIYRLKNKHQSFH
jgi:hypothetical protein